MSSAAWPIVARREIGVKLRDRNFLISTVFTIVIIVGSFAFQAFMASKGTEATIAVTNDTAQTVVQQAQQAATDDGDKTAYTALRVPDEAAARAAVTAGDADAALVQHGRDWTLIGKTDKDTGLQENIARVVTPQAIEQNAKEHGTSAADIFAGSTVGYDLTEPNGQDTTVGRVLGFVFSFLFYMAALIFGMQIAQSVVEEKQSRIVEILASAIPVNQLLAGKIAGNTLLALAQMALFVVAGLVGAAFTPVRDSLGAIAGASGWFLLFFLAGFLVLASFWAVAGSLATRNEDLQTTSTPISTLVLLILFGGLLATGTTQAVLSFVPLASAVAMPVRLAAGGVPLWQPIASLVISILAGWLVIRWAARIYRRSVMQTGRRLSVREAMRLED